MHRETFWLLHTETIDGVGDFSLFETETEALDEGLTVLYDSLKEYDSADGWFPKYLPRKEFEKVVHHPHFIENEDGNTADLSLFDLQKLFQDACEVSSYFDGYGTVEIVPVGVTRREGR